MHQCAAMQRIQKGNCQSISFARELYHFEHFILNSLIDLRTDLIKEHQLDMIFFKKNRDTDTHTKIY